MIPYGRQDITESDIDAVVAVLKSEYLTQGPVVPRFEDAVAARVGCAHAVAANSATSALHIACLALQVGPGDRVWTSPVTFVASANCALYCGARVDFVDVDPVSGNLCPRALATKLERAARAGELPKVVVAVHLAGEPCDMQSIASLGEHYGFRVIEDASHAIGGRYRNHSIGSCVYSDITVFSFHPVKVITTAEGGMAVTNDVQLARLMRLFRSHGVTRDPGEMTREPDGPWYYQQLVLGYNYRMTDVQASLGLSQLARLDAYVERRHRLADRYDGLLASLPLRTPQRNPENYSGLHLYVVRLQVSLLQKSYLAVFEAMRARGIGVNLHYIPVHTQPYFERMGFRVGDFPEAERYAREALSLPMYPTLTEEQQDVVVDALSRVLLQ